MGGCVCVVYIGVIRLLLGRFGGLKGVGSNLRSYFYVGFGDSFVFSKCLILFDKFILEREIFLEMKGLRIDFIFARYVMILYFLN